MQSVYSASPADWTSGEEVTEIMENLTLSTEQEEYFCLIKWIILYQNMREFLLFYKERGNQFHD